MPPIVQVIISIIQLAIKYAPDAAKAYDKARVLIKMWFDGGVITVEQQAQLMNRVDAHQAATLAGNVPPEFLVEPDPT
jgi:hypothetical protein